jgi:hypothetical protein
VEVLNYQMDVHFVIRSNLEAVGGGESLCSVGRPHARVLGIRLNSDTVGENWT